MDNPVSFHPGSVPLLISIPHSGTQVTDAVRNGLIDQAQGLPDTDWHIPRLYDFALELGASVVAGQYSRFVIDLNRPADDKPLYAGATTGLYPACLFDGIDLYREGATPTAEERARYLEQIWQPYHQAVAAELARLREKFGYAMLWEAHSIRSVLPMLFEGTLPDLNLGTFNGASCNPELAARLESICANAEGFSYSLNGRFKGGYITRQYGDPESDIHAVQLELTQRNYMDEFAPFEYRQALAEKTQAVLKPLLQTMLAWGQEHYNR